MTFGGKRVLVVEDEFLVSLTTIDFLESIGCEVVGPAASLSAAIQLAHTEPLDAAVLDINIAGEMIWPVTKELQRRNVPFVFLSAYPVINVIPAHLDAVPRLGKPLEQIHLQRHLHAIWGTGCD